MTPDASLLPVLSDPDRYRIVVHLLEHAATQKQLGASLELNSGTLSKHMRVLEGAGLVRRERKHSPYELLFKDRMQILLRDIANFELEIAEEKVGGLKEQTEMLRRAGVRETKSSNRSESA